MNTKLIIEKNKLVFGTFYDVTIEGDKGGIRLWIYKKNPRELFLSNLYVKEQYRKNGLGRELLDYSQKAAKKLGIKRLVLKVVRNTWMKDWYLRYGFLEDDDNRDPLILYLYKNLCS